VLMLEMMTIHLVIPILMAQETPILTAQETTTTTTIIRLVAVGSVQWTGGFLNGILHNGIREGYEFFIIIVI